jgi:hypothetical protein
VNHTFSCVALRERIFIQEPKVDEGQEFLDQKLGVIPLEIEETTSESSVRL